MYNRIGKNEVPGELTGDNDFFFYLQKLRKKEVG